MLEMVKKAMNDGKVVVIHAVSPSTGTKEVTGKVLSVDAIGVVIDTLAGPCGVTWGFVMFFAPYPE